MNYNEKVNSQTRLIIHVEIYQVLFLFWSKYHIFTTFNLRDFDTTSDSEYDKASTQNCWEDTMNIRSDFTLLKFMNGILLRWTSKDINNVNSCLSLWHMSKVWPQTARLEIYFGKTSSCTEQGHANIWEAGSWNCTKTSIGEKEQNDITLFSIRALQ